MKLATVQVILHRSRNHARYRAYCSQSGQSGQSLYVIAQHGISGAASLPCCYRINFYTQIYYTRSRQVLLRQQSCRQTSVVYLLFAQGLSLLKVMLDNVAFAPFPMRRGSLCCQEKMNLKAECGTSAQAEQPKALQLCEFGSMLR